MVNCLLLACAHAPLCKPTAVISLQTCLLKSYKADWARMFRKHGEHRLSARNGNGLQVWLLAPIAGWIALQTATTAPEHRAHAGQVQKHACHAAASRGSP